jgi:hypothetical protein
MTIKQVTPIQTGILVFLVVLPRVLRLAAPNIHIETPQYVYNAFLLTKGMVPFANFEQIHPPLLEMILAGLYFLFGATVRIPEILSALAHVATALILYRLATRFHSRHAGFVSAILYSWHFLLFRYHLFARETFSTLAILAGIAMMSRKKSDQWSLLTGGLLIGLAVAFEQSAIVAAIALILFLLLFRHNIRRAAMVCLGAGALTAVITGGYSLIFGGNYVNTVFVRYFVDGHFADWRLKALWTISEIRYLIPPAIAAIVFMKHPKSDDNWLGTTLVGVHLIYFWFVFADFHIHHLLVVLPFFSVLAGITTAELYNYVKIVVFSGRDHDITGGADINLRRKRIGLSLAILILATGMYFLLLPELPAGATRKHGFYGVPRSDVHEAAGTIRDNTSTNDMIIADPVIALEAQRINLLRHRVVRYHIPLIETGFFRDEIGAFQQDYFLFLRDDYLLMQDMVIGLSNEHYTIWIRSGGVQE